MTTNNMTTNNTTRQTTRQDKQHGNETTRQRTTRQRNVLFEFAFEVLRVIVYADLRQYGQVDDLTEFQHLHVFAFLRHHRQGKTETVTERTVSQPS